MSGEAPKILDVFLGLYSGGQPQLSLLNEGKCNGEWQIDRKGTREHREQVYIEEVTMSLLLLSQPDKAAEFFTNKRVDDQGTIGRFIVVDPKAKKQRRGGVKRRFDETIKEDYSTFITQLASRSEEQTRIKVRCGEEARNIFDNYYNENLDLSEEAEESGQNGEAQIYSRSAEIAINLSLILYIEDGEDSEVLEASTAKRAVELHQYFRRCSIQFLREAKNFSEKSLFQRIVNTITKKRRVTRSKLLKLNNYKAADLDAFQKAISDGEVKGVTIESEKASNGKPQTTFIAT
jgi:hypothetical protein